MLPSFEEMCTSGPPQLANGSNTVDGDVSMLGSREEVEGVPVVPNRAESQSPIKPRVVLDAVENVVRRD